MNGYIKISILLIIILLIIILLIDNNPVAGQVVFYACSRYNKLGYKNLGQKIHFSKSGKIQGRIF